MNQYRYLFLFGFATLLLHVYVIIIKNTDEGEAPMITVSVDDKIASARLISDMMKKLDPDGTHEEEKDPEKALERIVRLHPDIVWLDIEMSGISRMTSPSADRRAIVITTSAAALTDRDIR